ncbi:MAG: hypothetical protein ACTSU5_10010 [Promethearchaeota archaeon]
MARAKKKDSGVIQQGSIAQFMRKRTQLVGFDYGIYKHVQYIAEFIDNSLDAIEKFQWEEEKKKARGEENYSFTLDQDISLENLSLGIEQGDSLNSSVELKGGLKKTDLAEAFDFSGDAESTLASEGAVEEESDELDEDQDGGTRVEDEGDAETAPFGEEDAELEAAAEDEIEEIEEEVLEKEVRDIVIALEDFINPVVNLVDEEPFIIIKITETDVEGILAQAMGNKDAKMFTFEIFDNGTGMVPEDLQKFGKYLASSKSQKLKQTRGSQGFGSPSAFSDAQNTTGKPIVAVSKHASELYAIATQFFTTSKNTKKYVFPPTEISVPFNHGTYIKLNYINVRYRKGFADKYIRQAAILNPHVTIIYIEPETTKKKRDKGSKNKITIFPRLVSKFPEEPKYALPHPGSVNIGDFQDLIRNSENITVSAFLTENFVRLSGTLAKKIISQAERELCLHHSIIPLKNAFVTKTNNEKDTIYHITEEMRVFGRSTKKRKTWVVRYLEPKDDPEFSGKFFELTGKILTIESKNEKLSKKIATLKRKKEKEAVKKVQRVIQKEINAIDKDIKANMKEIVKLEAQVDKLVTPYVSNFAEVTDENEKETEVDKVKEILVSKTRPRECTMEQINHLFVAFKAQKYLAPPTDTAIPVGSEILENVLIKEYGLDIPQRLDFFRKVDKELQQETDPSLVKAMLTRFMSPVLEKGRQVTRAALGDDSEVSSKNYEDAIEFLEESRAISDDFVAGETRDPTSGKGLAFSVEAAVAMSPKIPPVKKAQDVLARYVNRTPKLRDNSDCAIWQSVAKINWKNYKVDTFDNGIPKGNIRIFINVSGPFVHLMFKSQSKNALAEDENLAKEIKLCLESIGRRMRAYLNKKVTREQRKKRSSVLIKHVPQFVESIYNIANSDGRFKGKLNKELLKKKLIEAIGQKATPAVPTDVPEEGAKVKAETATGEGQGETLPAGAAVVETTIAGVPPGGEEPPAGEVVKPATTTVESEITPLKPEKKVEKGKKARPAKKTKPAKKAPPKKAAKKVKAPATLKKPSRTGKVVVGTGKSKVPRKVTKPQKRAKIEKPKKKSVQKKTGEPLVIDKVSIINSLSEWSTIRDLISKMHIVSMMDARFLQIKLRQLEKEGAVLVEIRKGKKYWKAP